MPVAKQQLLGSTCDDAGLDRQRLSDDDDDGRLMLELMSDKELLTQELDSVKTSLSTAQQNNHRSLSLSVCLSVSVCLSACVCLPVCLSACVCLSVCLFCLSVCLPVCYSVSLCLYVCVCLPVCLSVCLPVSVCLSVSLSVCVCICLYVFICLSFTALQLTVSCWPPMLTF